MEDIPLAKKLEIVQSWKDDPLVRHRCFSDRKLWVKQVEILQAIRNHKRVCVKSANTIGKTAIAADIVIDWLFTRGPKAKVITTSSSWTQVEDVLWKEINSFCVSSKWPLGAEVLNTSLKLSDDWFAIGISTDTPVRFQGFHSPHLLILADEASGIAPDIWEMFEALHPEAILALGNPLEANGKFFDCFHSDLWHKITVSALECVLWQDKNGRIPGLVTREWINEMGEMHGTKSPWYRIHVLGEFPEQDEFAIIERSWVDRARKGLDCDGLELDEEYEDKEKRIISIDLASKHGENLTVIGYRYGHTFKELRLYPRVTSSFARDEAKTLYIKTEAHTLVADADGLGENFADVMSDVHVPCMEFHGGSGVKAIKYTKFKNLRSQFYWIVSKKFEKGLYNLKHLPQKEFELLREQLCSIRAVSKDPLGRFQIESKDDMMARQIKSPDLADTFMMSEFGHYMHHLADIRPVHYGNL